MTNDMRSLWAMASILLAVPLLAGCTGPTEADLPERRNGFSLVFGEMTITHLGDGPVRASNGSVVVRPLFHVLLPEWLVGANIPEANHFFFVTTPDFSRVEAQITLCPNAGPEGCIEDFTRTDWFDPPVPWMFGMSEIWWQASDPIEGSVPAEAQKSRLALPPEFYQEPDDRERYGNEPDSFEVEVGDVVRTLTFVGYSEQLVFEWSPSSDRIQLPLIGPAKGMLPPEGSRDYHEFPFGEAWGILESERPVSEEMTLVVAWTIGRGSVYLQDANENHMLNLSRMWTWRVELHSGGDRVAYEIQKRIEYLGPFALDPEYKVTDKGPHQPLKTSSILPPDRVLLSSGAAITEEVLGERVTYVSITTPDAGQVQERQSYVFGPPPPPGQPGLQFVHTVGFDAETGHLDAAVLPPDLLAKYVIDLDLSAVHSGADPQ